jgi:hypothetical protein
MHKDQRNDRHVVTDPRKRRRRSRERRHGRHRPHCTIL